MFIASRFEKFPAWKPFDPGRLDFMWNFFQADTRTPGTGEGRSRCPVWILETSQLANWEISWGWKKAGVRLSHSGIRYDALRMNSFSLPRSTSCRLSVPRSTLCQSADPERKYLTKSRERLPGYGINLRPAESQFSSCFEIRWKLLKHGTDRGPRTRYPELETIRYPFHHSTLDRHRTFSIVRWNFHSRHLFHPCAPISVFFCFTTVAHFPGLQHNAKKT